MIGGRAVSTDHVVFLFGWCRTKRLTRNVSQWLLASEAALLGTESTCASPTSLATICASLLQAIEPTQEILDKHNINRCISRGLERSAGMGESEAA